jgi:hypothetical protein
MYLGREFGMSATIMVIDAWLDYVMDLFMPIYDCQLRVTTENY